jgi:hypothetical protein
MEAREGGDGMVNIINRLIAIAKFLQVDSRYLNIPSQSVRWGDPSIDQWNRRVLVHAVSVFIERELLWLRLYWLGIIDWAEYRKMLCHEWRMFHLFKFHRPRRFELKSMRWQ